MPIGLHVAETADADARLHELGFDGERLLGLVRDVANYHCRRIPYARPDSPTSSPRSCSSRRSARRSATTRRSRAARVPTRPELPLGRDEPPGRRLLSPAQRRVRRQPERLERSDRAHGRPARGRRRSRRGCRVRAVHTRDGRARRLASFGEATRPRAPRGIGLGLAVEGSRSSRAARREVGAAGNHAMKRHEVGGKGEPRGATAKRHRCPRLPSSAILPHSRDTRNAFGADRRSLDKSDAACVNCIELSPSRSTAKKAGTTRGGRVGPDVTLSPEATLRPATRQ